MIALGPPLLTLVVALASYAAAASGEHWLRDPALSPDGRSIAFRSNGDLYVAAIRGGEARLLRGTPARETMPVWLPGGGKIAYATDVNGGFDVYVVGSDGRGEPQRLTWHSRDEVPVAASPDGTRLLVRSGRLDLSDSHAAYPMVFESGEEPVWPRLWAGLFALPVGGGMPEPLIEPVSLEGGWDAGGALVFSVRPGSETVYRKHERSPATWDIWLRERDGRSFRQLTRFDGMDTTPIASRADGLIYYLSERSGSLNVWRMPLEGDARAEQVTRHERHPVRGLSVSDDGTLAYSFRGELYAGKAGGEIRKISLRLPRRAALPQSAQTRDLTAGLSSACLSPTGRVAVVAARGEIYAVERGSSRWRRLYGAHAGAKSSPTFSSDGSKLLVVRDRGAASDLLLAQVPADGSGWMNAAEPRVKALAATTRDTILASAISPAGDRAVYSTGDRLRLISLADGGAARDLLTRDRGFTERPQPFVWHPHANVLALPWLNLQRMPLEVALLDGASGELLNVSQSGFADQAPLWSADGRSLLWLSDRHGLRTFKGSDGTMDVVSLFLDPGRQRAHEAKLPWLGAPAGDREVGAWLAELRADPRLSTDRRARITPDSAALDAVALAPSGRFLLRLQHGHAGSEVWKQPLPEGNAVRLASLPKSEAPSEYFESNDSVQIGSDESTALVLAGGTAHWLDTATGKALKVSLAAVPAGDAAAEQRWVFEHIVRAVPRVFFRPDRLPTMGWPEQVEEYRRLLPAASAPGEFIELLQELLGELDASHTFLDRTPAVVTGRTGSLGVIFDTGHAGPGLRLQEILRNSPLAKSAPQAQPGDIVMEIDGRVVPARADPAQWLAYTADRPTRLKLGFRHGAERTVDVQLIDGVREAELFYGRWVSWRRGQTERLSARRLGYVHMPSMDEDTMRPVIDDVLGRYANAEGIVLDLRYNQGGWMHEPLLAFFSAKLAFELRANGTMYATEPATRAGRPIVTLVNEANYSNGFESPRLLREQGVSKLVGSAIAGTGIGWNFDSLPYWEYGYGVAHDASQTPAGEDWEGVTQMPDIAVDADRAALRDGRDLQLEAAVRDLLKALPTPAITTGTR